MPTSSRAATGMTASPRSTAPSTASTAAPATTSCSRTRTTSSQAPAKTSGGSGAPLGPHASLPRGPARLAQPPRHPFATQRVQPRVEPADLGEDLVRHLLLLFGGRLGDGVPAHRLAVLDGHLRELQALPVADLRGT